MNYKEVVQHNKPAGTGKRTYKTQGRLAIGAALLKPRLAHLLKVQPCHVEMAASRTPARRWVGLDKC